ncbi:MAG: CBS domain-containing protein [Elusimicrobiota bacterium]|jgi:CBS domain-containing protein/sporulation protein YlmC with PRC-barrel domain
MDSTTFTYLTFFIGIPVLDASTGKRIGTCEDIAAGLREMYPRASGIVVRKGRRGPRAYIPWKNVRWIEDRRAAVVDLPAAFSRELRLPDNEILLKASFWDKQIVDISGSKVVRVNDLHLLREDQSLWLVHMDVGIPGLLRRLGWSRWTGALFRLFFGFEMKDRLISWKFVQPITHEIGAEALALKVHHSKLSELHPADLAEIFTDLGLEERAAILRALDHETLAKVFQSLPMAVRTQTAQQLEIGHLRTIVEAMAADEAVDFLAQTPKRLKNELFARMEPAKASQFAELLKVSGRVAASLMNTEFLRVGPETSARQMLDKIRASSPRREAVRHCYVEDGRGLVGVVTLRQLLNVDPAVSARMLMRRRVVSIPQDLNLRDTAALFAKYDFTVLPVVDEENRVRGIITMKDAFLAVAPQLRGTEDAA